ncbi:MAG: deoxyribodipyrimidine photo-lyase, partial [Maribacter sp.]
ESSDRHWRFVYQSLEGIASQLKKYQQEITVLHGEAKDVFSELTNTYNIRKIYSHVEVGLKATYDRNEKLRLFFNTKNIFWIEVVQEGIIKGIKNRNGWERERLKYLNSVIVKSYLNQLNTVVLSDDFYCSFDTEDLDENIIQDNPNFQYGGEFKGRELLYSFLEKRHKIYINNISKPHFTTESCSRLSPYLAYGCLSVREVYQAVKKELNRHPSNDNLEKYLIRLFWRSHYMQKLETEWELEFKPTNKALSSLEKSDDDELFYAWANGKTGYPIIDAAIKSLEETGYANFRMRAILVTFSTLTLWQDWKRTAIHLARLFLDFEPSIHYGQVHMQAGLTGHHLLKIYSPSAQSHKHDKENLFVKKWLPELAGLPSHFVVKPWKMTLEEQQKYNCILGRDYPDRIIEFEIASNIAKIHYWNNRQRQEVFDELPKIFEKHCLPKNIPNYQRALEMNLEEFRKIQKKLYSKSS